MAPCFASLADAVLVLHAILVFFNVGALPLIWVGHSLRWRFVRNFYFRAIHLLLIGVVAAESVFGVICPLTLWEENLRTGSGNEPLHPQGFIAHWLHRWLFYDFPDWVFTTAYVTFFVLVLLTLWLVPPNVPFRAWRGKRRDDS